MRVLMFGWEFPPYQSGGLATATLGLVKGLLGRGADVTLVVPFPVATPPFPQVRIVSAARRFERLKHLRVPSPLTAYDGERAYVEALRTHVTGTQGGPVYGANLFDEVERFAAVAEDIAAEEEHDVIDAHDWITYRAGMAARRVSGRPLIAHIHATEFDRSGEAAVNGRISHREWEGLSAADLVISNSNTLKQQVVRRYGISASKIAVVHWGIDDETPSWSGARPNPLPTEQPVVLFLGRVTRQKGPDYFVEIARRVIEFVPTARFVMAGTGDMLPQVINRAVELGLADRLHFAGPVAGRDVDRAFKLATVCVMPSVSEPFGLVALESIRSGTPCIVPKGSGAAEVLRNAFKVDFWDTNEMTNKIVAILRYRELHHELSRQGSDELRDPRFSLDDPARLTLDVYEQALTTKQVLIA